MESNLSRYLRMDGRGMVAQFKTECVSSPEMDAYLLWSPVSGAFAGLFEAASHHDACVELARDAGTSVGSDIEQIDPDQYESEHFTGAEILAAIRAL